MPKFVLKEMESLYIEELKSSINLLMANLESLPVSKGSMDSKYGLQKLKRYNHRLHNHNNPYNVKHILMHYVTSFRSQGSLAKLEGDSADSDTTLTKMDVVLTFQLEVMDSIYKHCMKIIFQGKYIHKNYHFYYDILLFK